MIRQLVSGAALALLLSSTSRAAVRHHYTFNDGTANDSVGGAHGTLEAGAAIAAGQLTLAGQGQYVNLPSTTIGINAYTATTLEMWLNVNPATVNSFTMAVAFGRHGEPADDNPTTTPNEGAYGHDYIMLQPTRGDVNNPSRPAITDDYFLSETGVNGPILAGTGQRYMAVTIDSTAGPDNTTLTYYRDGALVAAAPGADDLSDVSDLVAYLGRSVYNDPFFSGQINEFRIHDSILSATEISNNAAAGPAGAPGPTLTIDRVTGAMTLSNQNSAIQIYSYSINSASGALNPAAWRTVAGTTDAAGNGSFDPDDQWAVVTSTNDQLVEEEPLGGGGPDNGGTLGSGALGSLQLNDGALWIRSFREDVNIVLQTLIDGVPTPFVADVEYTGNGGQPFQRSDLNFDSAINGADWDLYRSNHLKPIDPMLSDAASYAVGDLDGDQDNDFFDFRLFQQDFDAANGVGALAALARAVPEPCGAALLAPAFASLAAFGRRRTRQSEPAV